MLIHSGILCNITTRNAIKMGLKMLAILPTMSSMVMSLNFKLEKQVYLLWVAVGATLKD